MTRIILLLIFTLTITACGGGGDSSTTAEESVIDLTVQEQCEADGKYWWNDQCNDLPEPTPQEQCEADGKYWWNDQCNDLPEPTPQEQCEADGKYWWNDQCNDLPEPTPQEQCEADGKYWWNDQCNDLPEPTPQEQCEADGKYWWNDQCNDLPEPTPQEQCEADGKYWWNDQCNEQPRYPWALDVESRWEIPTTQIEALCNGDYMSESEQVECDYDYDKEEFQFSYATTGYSLENSIAKLTFIINQERVENGVLDPAAYFYNSDYEQLDFTLGHYYYSWYEYICDTCSDTVRKDRNLAIEKLTGGFAVNNWEVSGNKQDQLTMLGLSKVKYMINDVPMYYEGEYVRGLHARFLEPQFFREAYKIFEYVLGERELTPQEQCEADGKFWWNEQCNISEKPTSQEQCESEGRFWWSNQCHDSEKLDVDTFATDVESRWGIPLKQIETLCNGGYMSGSEQVECNYDYDKEEFRFSYVTTGYSLANATAKLTFIVNQERVANGVLDPAAYFYNPDYEQLDFTLGAYYYSWYEYLCDTCSETVRKDRNLALEKLSGGYEVNSWEVSGSQNSELNLQGLGVTEYMINDVPMYYEDKYVRGLHARFYEQQFFKEAHKTLQYIYKN